MGRREWYAVAVFSIVLLVAIFAIVAIIGSRGVDSPGMSAGIVEAKLPSPPDAYLDNLPTLAQGAVVGQAFARQDTIDGYAMPYDPIINSAAAYVVIDVQTNGYAVTVRNETKQFVYSVGYYSSRAGGAKQWLRMTSLTPVIPGTQWVAGEATFFIPKTTAAEAEEYVSIFACRQYPGRIDFICGPYTLSSPQPRWTIQSYNPTICVPKTAAQACGTFTCGLVSDGCTGQVSCGTCASGVTCTNPAGGFCQQTGCAGGTACGQACCTGAQTCTSNGCCTPRSVASACGTLQCGQQSDGCGGTVTCGPSCAGTCANPYFCSSTQPTNAQAMPTLTCAAGSCYSCISPNIGCGGQCVNSLTDTNNCGACGTRCDTANGQVCANGQCTSPCVSDCTAQGAARCSGQNAYQVCNAVPGQISCLKWSVATACGVGTSCSGAGVCGSVCQSNCPAVGAKQCSGTTGYQVCGAANGQPNCLVWSATTSCLTGQACSGGECTSSCVSDCSTAGARECVGTTLYRSCTTTTGCLKWTGASACPLGQVCSGAGTCSVSGGCAGCTIGGQCIANGQPNIANTCQYCNSSLSTSAWSNRISGATCSSGGQSGTCQNNVCTVAGCTGCTINGQCYADNQVNPTNACLQCTVSQSTSSWTPKPTGATCPSGTCSNGQCTTMCSPAPNECQTCNGGTLASKANGAACTGGTCQNGACQQPQACTSSCTVAEVGTKKCASQSGYQTCIAVSGQTACYQWTATVSCPLGQLCFGSGTCSLTAPVACANTAGQFCSSTPPSSITSAYSTGAGTCTASETCYRCATGYSPSGTTCVATPSAACLTTAGQLCAATPPSAGTYSAGTGTCAAGQSCYKCNTPGYTPSGANCVASSASCTGVAGQFCSASLPSATPAAYTSVTGTCTVGMTCYKCNSPGYTQSGATCVPAAGSCTSVTGQFCAVAAPATGTYAVGTGTCTTGQCYTCNTGYYQSGSLCMSLCTSTCTAAQVGQRQCFFQGSEPSSAGQYQTCQLVAGQTSCYQWGGLTSCGYSPVEFCTGAGVCTPLTTLTTCLNTPGQFCGIVPPSSTVAAYSIGTGNCVSGQTCYKCNTGYSRTGSACVADTASATCTNTAGQFCSTSAPFAGTYAPGTGTCTTGQCYRCNSGYTQSGTSCVSNTASCYSVGGQFCSTTTPTTGTYVTRTGTCSSGQCYACNSGYTQQNVSSSAVQCVSSSVSCPGSIAAICNSGTSCSATATCGGQTYYCRSFNGGAYAWAAQTACYQDLSGQGLQTMPYCTRATCAGTTYECQNLNSVGTWVTNLCTTQACNAATGACGTTPNCDDGLSCTDDIVSNTLCIHSPKLNTCLISNACYTNGVHNPSNDCQYCGTGSQNGWSNMIDGYVCLQSNGQSGVCIAGSCQQALTVSASHSPSGSTLPLGSTVTVTATTNRAATISISMSGASNTCTSATTCSATSTYSTSNYYFYDVSATNGVTVGASGGFQIVGCSTNSDCQSWQICSGGQCRTPTCADMTQCVGAGRCGTFYNVCGTTTTMSNCGCSGADVCHGNQYCAPSCTTGGLDCSQYGMTCETASGRCV